MCCLFHYILSIIMVNILAKSLVRGQAVSVMARDYLMISSIVAMSSAAIDTFDFSIRIFPPVIM